MPQLNPAPWFSTLIITWAIALTLLKLMTPLHHTTPPTKHALSYKPATWTWTWL